MNIKKIILCTLAAALLALSLSACSANSTDGSQPVSAVRSNSAAEYAEDVYLDSGDTVSVLTSGSGGSTSGSSITLPENRKWVISMSLSAETEDLDTAMQQLSARVDELGGYIESQSINGSSTTNETRYAYFTIRVPADQVDGFVDEVSGMTNVVSSSRRVEDITLTYSDTEGHITALETEEARLLELMEQAESMSDLLEIEERLTEVRTDLENYSSALKLYDNQVDYATVNLYISEVEKYTPAVQESFWGKIGQGLQESFANLGQAIADGFSWFVIHLPYLVLVALAVWVVVLLIRRAIRKHKAKKPQKKAE